MAKWFTKIKELDYNDTFAPITHLEDIQIFLAYAAPKCFKVYQMDVKSDFINNEFDS